MASVFLVGLPVLEAEAKRLGSGGNIGRTAPSSPAKTAPGTPAKPAQPQTAPQGQSAQSGAKAPATSPAPVAQRSSWMGPLAGIAAGLGLAALAAYLGFSEELMSLLLIVLAVMVGFMVIRLIMGRRQPAPAGAGYREPGLARQTYGEEAPQSPRTSGSLGGSVPVMTPPAAPGVIAVSQEEMDSFIRVAREQFTRLQSIWDRGDIYALAEFCTPEMTRELSHQIADRKGTDNVTQVVQLSAQWLGMFEGEDDFGKPVDEVRIRFSGLIRESANGVAEDFSEVWTLHRAKEENSGWLLAGISQAND